VNNDAISRKIIQYFSRWNLRQANACQRQFPGMERKIPFQAIARNPAK
jgi:hypothetical protein